MSTPAPAVSVVIPTYERLRSLRPAVEAVLSDPAAHEVVVVVDGSTDGTVDWLTARARDDARLVAVLQQNGGVGIARQTGVERATGEIVLLLDDDVIAEPGLVAGHAQHHRRSPGRLVVGYMPNDWEQLPPGRRAIAQLYRRRYEETCADYEADPSSITLGLWAGNFSLPRSTALAVGLAPRHGVPGRGYHDDRDFGLRCRIQGIDAVFDRSLRARHDYERDVKGFRRDAQDSGYLRRTLHAAYADVDLDEPGGGLRGPIRRALRRATRYEVSSRMLAGALELALRLAGVLRLGAVELLSARALAVVETMRGVARYDQETPSARQAST